MIYVGIDVSLQRLEVGTAERRRLTRSFANTAAGIQALLQGLGAWGEGEQPHLILEPTSTYHQALVVALAAAGVRYTLINPRRTRAYAQLQGRRAKTDRVDAHLLAALGESEHPEPSLPPLPDQEALKALRRHRDWLESEARAVRSRLEAARRSPWAPAAVLASLERTLRQLEEEAQSLSRDLEAHVAAEPVLAAQVQLLRTIQGVGERTAVLVLSELPPVERCRSAKAWAAFCGVHPAIEQSGMHTWSHLSREGPARVRGQLYLAGVSALRWNPVVQAQGERLQARGKSGKVRAVAAMHKLLRLCYGVLKSGQPFDPTRHLLPTP